MASPPSPWMENDIDTQFVHRISLIENSLLGFQPSCADAFYRQYDSYTNDLEAAIRANFLSPSTTTLAISLSNKVHYMMESLDDLEALSARLMGSFLEEASTILDSYTTYTTSPSADLPDSAPSAYIRPSYDWLVEHIHNPYPSTRVRDAIVKMSGAARKDVDNWFIDARKRIGWNAARKAHFSNKRIDIVDAATRFYANDEKLALGQDAELALVSIMKNAKDLYSDKFDETPLATKLATVVKDLTPQTKAEAKAERLRQSQLKKDRDSYPSPDRSPEPTRLSPVPCDDDELGHASSQPISTTNRKRRSPSVEVADADQSNSRPAKRSRLDSPSTSPKNLSIHTGLPSPASSVDEPLEALDPPSSSSSPPSPPSPNLAVTSRKRRLSESDGQAALKRPRNLPPGPRLQAVSDPLSLFSIDAHTSPFDGWFERHFDTPSLPDDSSSGFDFELGAFPDIDCGPVVDSGEVQSTVKHLIELISGKESTQNTNTEEVLELPTPEVSPEASPSARPENKDFSFGELQSLWSTDFSSAYSDQVPVSLEDLYVPQIPSLDFHLLNHFGDFHTSSPPLDSIQAFSPLDFSNVPWGLDASASHFDIAGSKSSLVPENGLGLHSPLIVTPSCYDDPSRPPGQAAVRAEKIMQLLKMKEEALRLELELAST